MSPSVRALLMQCLAFPLMLGAVFGLARCGAAISFLHVALIQGAIAAALGWGRLASWWRPIQFLFPLALLGASRLALPPAWFLAGFVVLLLVFWSTFRTQVPYYPSGRAVPTAVASLLPGRPVRVIDIGSGLGGLVLELARARPESRFEGIELAPLPWFASRLRAALGRSRARFIRGDYEDLDFGHYDLVFAYLSPAAMDALWRKARREMRPGSLLVSYEFVVDGCRPDRIVAPTDGGPTLNIWHL
jgi:SAM-dependent methyltransferase